MRVGDRKYLSEAPEVVNIISGNLRLDDSGDGQRGMRVGRFLSAAAVVETGAGRVLSHLDPSGFQQ